jgi:preprotein translocase subunit Sss1
MIPSATASIKAIGLGMLPIGSVGMIIVSILACNRSVAS